MNSIQQFFLEAGHILLDSSFYILVGIVVAAGVLKVTMNTNTVLRHLGHGRFSSVVKASFLGVPLPL
ncbi:MAG: hypothetical protein CR992_01065 [Desulfobacterales bacterium]|nr:MAG: hypothetical protein CR992_01065 [Desulfobacterales bacterium]